MGREPTDTVQLKLRFRESLRKELEIAAKAHNHSLNSEIVRRLEFSIMEENHPVAPHTLSLMRTLATVISILEHQMGGRWDENLFVFEAVLSGVDRILHTRRPDDPDDHRLEKKDLYREAKLKYETSLREYRKLHADLPSEPRAEREDFLEAQERYTKEWAKGVWAAAAMNPSTFNDVSLRIMPKDRWDVD